MIGEAEAGIAEATELGLMHTSFSARDGRVVTLPGGHQAVEFINCSYLGLDTWPQLIAGAKRALDDFGVHFCCARSRLTIEPNVRLEAELSELFRGHAITFPTVTAAHMSVLPTLASGRLLPGSVRSKTRFIFDKHAHASMQFLRPIIAAEASAVTTIAHNDLQALEDEAKAADRAGETPVYLADGVYSMGGLCPLPELVELSEKWGIVLYLDDAHGTSIFGRHGEGSVRGAWDGDLPETVIVNFSLAKGFGCNGGGVLLPSKWQADRVRRFGMTYGFSAPLDFSIVGAALESTKLHRDGTVERLQRELRARVARFDERVGSDTRNFSPIRRVVIGDEAECRAVGARLLERGYLVSTAFFPVVARGKAQLRVCLGVDHTDAQIDGFAEALDASRAALARTA
ncbi:MAG: aminotransferase class I/II-fold pyridoxal phosphate-dependent enzyme [Myxococcus sp.]|nr:aminotransferase class I/II-fold pyridoxal phosphate-dependent enzyme [Myxococcus sp.]